MAELSITPKRNAKTVPKIYDKNANIKTEARERKRNILYLIYSYLVEQKLCSAAEALENEAQLNSQYQVCENIDLDIILQEYQSYYFTKFQKFPKITRKGNENTGDVKLKMQRKNSAKLRSREVKEISVSPSENEENDFQFEIVSISPSKSEPIYQKPSMDNILFENYSTEWREMAEQIIKECIPQNLGVSWNDCIGLHNPIEKLKEAVVYPIMYPDIFKNVSVWKGVLLFGPPGTGKTLLAKALASEGSTFINVMSSIFVSKWRGESEKMIKVLFDLAKYYAPTTIFIDEVDALASTTELSQHDASRRFKSEFLTQIDGTLSCEANIFILGSTNLPWNLDSAVLRRFEKRILVPLPDEGSRVDLLKQYLTAANNIEQKEIEKLAAMTKHFSGSDIKTLCKDTTMHLVREKLSEMNTNQTNRSKLELRKLTYRDVEQALKKLNRVLQIMIAKDIMTGMKDMDHGENQKTIL